MVSCASENDKPNIITIAWAGTVCSQPPMVSVSVRKERHSHHIIKETGEFAINLTTADMVRAADSCGIYTGRKVDKFTRFHLSKEESSYLSCPLIAESPLSLCCRVTDVIPMGSHDMFLADIVGIEVDPSLLDKEGRLHLEWAHLAAFAHGQYYELGRQIGPFGFSVKKEKRHAPKKKSGR